MVTRRITTKSAVLKFNPEWIKDPAPPFLKNLDKATVKELAAAKKQFVAQVKQILTKAKG